jgi:large-conductance mechanosensitive channel
MTTQPEQIVSSIASNVTGTYKNIFYDFQQFMFGNDVLVAAAGFSIGMATKEMIERLVTAVVLPIVHFVLKFSLAKIAYTKILETFPGTHMASVLGTVGAAVWDIFVWIIIIIMTFMILEYILNRKIVGLKSTVKDDNMKDFAKAKATAGDNIIPTQKEVKDLEKKEYIEKKAGEKLIEINDIHMEQVAGKDVPPSTNNNKMIMEPYSQDLYALFN